MILKKWNVHIIISELQKTCGPKKQYPNISLQNSPRQRASGKEHQLVAAQGKAIFSQQK